MNASLRSRGLVLLLVTAVSLGAFAYLLLRSRQVPGLHPAVGPISQTVVASGTVMPPAELRLGSLVASTVEAVLVREGAVVSAGQILVKLDDSAARAALQQAQASLSSAQAGRAELSLLNAPAAEAQLREADTRATLAERQLKREEELFESGATTKSALEEAQTAAQVSQAQRNAAMLQFKAASQGGTRALSSQAAPALAKAQVSAAEVQLARHVIKAPADGIVLSRSIEPGDSVAQGSPLLVISTTGATRLRIEPDERNLALLEVGQPARASTEAFPEEKFEAKLSYIAPSVDPERGTIEVHLLVPKPPSYLRAHMTVSVEVIVAEKEKALTLPRRSVLDILDFPAVLLIQDGKVIRRNVTLGLQGDLDVEIARGLSQGDVIVRDPNQVEVGQSVSAQLGNAPSAE